MSKKVVPVVGAVFQQVFEGVLKVLLFRRAPGERGAGQWEFPGGKVEPGEADIQALEREIHEELGAKIKVGKFLGSNDFDAGERVIQLKVFVVQLQSGPFDNEQAALSAFSLTEHDAVVWASQNDIQNFRLSEPDVPLVDCCFKSH